MPKDQLFDGRHFLAVFARHGSVVQAVVMQPGLSRPKSKPVKELGSGGSVMEKDVTAAELNVTNPAGPTDALSTQVPRTMILTPRSKRDVASFEQY